MNYGTGIGFLKPKRRRKKGAKAQNFCSAESGEWDYSTEEEGEIYLETNTCLCFVACLMRGRDEEWEVGAM